MPHAKKHTSLHSWRDEVSQENLLEIGLSDQISKLGCYYMLGIYFFGCVLSAVIHLYSEMKDAFRGSYQFCLRCLRMSEARLRTLTLFLDISLLLRSRLRSNTAA